MHHSVSLNTTSQLHIVPVEGHCLIESVCPNQHGLPNRQGQRPAGWDYVLPRSDIYHGSNRADRLFSKVCNVQMIQTIIGCGAVASACRRWLLDLQGSQQSCPRGERISALGTKCSNRFCTTILIASSYLLNTYIVCFV